MPIYKKMTNIGPICRPTDIPLLGRGSFYFNYCLNSAWHGGDTFVALLRWYGSPGFLDSGLQAHIFFGLLFLIFLLTIPHRFSIGLQVWGVCWPVKAPRFLSEKSIFV